MRCNRIKLEEALDIYHMSWVDKRTFTGDNRLQAITDNYLINNAHNIE